MADERAELLTNARRALRRDGFAVLPQAVPAQHASAALRAVLRAVGHEKAVSLEEVGKQPLLLSVFRESGLASFVTDLLGTPLQAVHGCQVALLYPGQGCIPGTCTPHVDAPRSWHIDGLPKHAGGESGSLSTFTLLVGVALDTVSAGNAGALTLYPGGHARMHDWFSSPSLADLERRGEEALPRASLPLAPPHQVALSAGDAVVLHYLMPHSVSPHTGARLRPMLYFRIHAASAAQTWPERKAALLADLWTGMPAVRALSEAKDGALTLSALSLSLDEDAVRLRMAATAAHSASRWAESCDLHCRLWALRPDDTEASLRAGCAGAWAGTAEAASRGAAPLDAACAQLPALLWQQAVRVSSLAARGLCERALAAFRECVLCEGDVVRALQAVQPEAEWHRKLLLDALAAACGCAQKLGQGAAAVSALRFAFASRVPSAAPQSGADADVAAMSVQQLWTAGELHLHQQSKDASDWRRARAIYARLSLLQPTALWAHLGAAIAHGCSPAPDGALAEGYARAAAGVSPNSPLAAALLVKALAVQGETEAVKVAFEGMLACGAEEKEQRAHGWLFLDALGCVTAAGGGR